MSLISFSFIACITCDEKGGLPVYGCVKDNQKCYCDTCNESRSCDDRFRELDPEIMSSGFCPSCISIRQQDRQLRKASPTIN